MSKPLAGLSVIGLSLFFILALGMFNGANASDVKALPAGNFEAVANDSFMVAGGDFDDEKFDERRFDNLRFFDLRFDKNRFFEDERFGDDKFEDEEFDDDLFFLFG